MLGLYRITSLLVLVCRRDRPETINELVERIELSPKFDYGILRVQHDVVQRAGRVFSVCIVSVDMSAPMAETCEDWKKNTIFLSSVLCLVCAAHTVMVASMDFSL